MSWSSILVTFSKYVLLSLGCKYGQGVSKGYILFYKNQHLARPILHENRWLWLVLVYLYSVKHIYLSCTCSLLVFYNMHSMHPMHSKFWIIVKFIGFADSNIYWEYYCSLKSSRKRVDTQPKVLSSSKLFGGGGGVGRLFPRFLLFINRPSCLSLAVLF